MPAREEVAGVAYLSDQQLDELNSEENIEHNASEQTGITCTCGVRKRESAKNPLQVTNLEDQLHMRLEENTLIRSLQIRMR